MPEPPIGVANVTITKPATGATITASVRVTGAGGEFQVNDTTADDQVFPSIAMDASGDFVVSWTSYGQGGDAPNQSNVYAKQFVSNDALKTNNTTSVASEELASKVPGATREVLMCTTDQLPPANHVVAANAGFDGVVQLQVFETGLPPGSYYIGSGTLMLDRTHILTAAHMVDDDLGNMVATAVNVFFDLPTGRVMIPASQVYVDPQYAGEPWINGGDVAVLTLSQPAPAGVAGFGIATTDNAIGQEFTKLGYGGQGTGTTGVTVPAFLGISKLSGQNTFDGNGTLIGDNAGSLVYQFCNGTEATDSLGADRRPSRFGRGRQRNHAARRAIPADRTSSMAWSPG